MNIEKYHPYRRAEFIRIDAATPAASVSDVELEKFEQFDAIYRSLCAILYNYAPLSGHPGGSISSGRFVTALLYNNMLYDISDPERLDADMISYAAGHKALGLYALWALRNEIVRTGTPELLPEDIRFQLRLEDLLGFRRNPNTTTPLFRKLNAKALDGHPTPATPFVRLATGASGVGIGSSIGLAIAAADLFGSNTPYVHIIEGEGGLTPGRVSEALAAAGTASLKNVVLHIDWNQASIDSNFVCREDSHPGDYVQWDPCELTYLNDWNTILVEDGKDFRQIFAAQHAAATIKNHQPTAIVYKTIKGWNYGIEGNKSHGGGHSLCSAGFHQALQPLLKMAGKEMKVCKDVQECKGGSAPEIVEKCFWDALLIIRDILQHETELTKFFSKKVKAAQEHLILLNRVRRSNGPTLNEMYKNIRPETVPSSLQLVPGTSTTLRGELGKVLHHFNKISNGAFFTAAADLLGSTSVNAVGQDFASGYYNSETNPLSRTLSIGGICEDAMAGIMSGISSFGNHIGVGSSYGAFIVALGHIAARLHAIGSQAHQVMVKGPYHPFILIAAHAGIKTGEDGPTHADPQPLQLIQENFPKGTCITLTPWDPQEIWSLMSTAMKKRPAIICPFVTRPNEKVLDRKAMGLAPADASATGLYLLKDSLKENPDGIVVLQGSEVAYEFVQKALPLLILDGLDIAAYYVASAELFDLLPEEEKERIFPEEVAQRAMGISGFTFPTLYRWIQSGYGRRHSLYPFKQGHFLGSGKAESVVAEAGLDGESQYRAIKTFIKNKSTTANFSEKILATNDY